LAAAFFASLGPIFETEGTSLAFEAIPQSHGRAFVTQTAEALALVKAIGHPGIRVQIDTGAIFANREDFSVIAETASYASHAHLSEPGLLPVGTAGCDHAAVAAAFTASAFDGFLSVEMREIDAWASALERAAEVARTYYGMAPLETKVIE